MSAYMYAQPTPVASGLALEKDPGYAAPYAGIGNVWGSRNQMGYVPPSEAVPRWREAVIKALELDDSLDKAHDSMAALATWGEWDWPLAEREFMRALELNPNNPDTRRAYSHFLNIMGRPGEALPQIERALELDPFNAPSIAFHGVDLLFMHRYDDAVERFDDALATSPGLPFANISLSYTLHLQGKLEDALQVNRSFLSLVGDRQGLQALERGYQDGGYRGAMRQLGDTLARRSMQTHFMGVQVAWLYVRAGEKELALDWLERAYEDHDPGMPHIGLPLHEPLQNEPRFRALVRRMNLPL